MRGEEDLRLEEVADMAPYAVEKDFPVERAYEPPPQLFRVDSSHFGLFRR